VLLNDILWVPEAQLVVQAENNILLLFWWKHQAFLEGFILGIPPPPPHMSLAGYLPENFQFKILIFLLASFIFLITFYKIIGT
jgi:hypothetical protein